MRPKDGRNSGGRQEAHKEERLQDGADNKAWTAPDGLVLSDPALAQDDPGTEDERKHMRLIQGASRVRLLSYQSAPVAASRKASEVVQMSWDDGAAREIFIGEHARCSRSPSEKTTCIRPHMQELMGSLGPAEMSQYIRRHSGPTFRRREHLMSRENGRG